MHGHSPGLALLVNAEVDSMGGVVDSEVGLDTKTSPRRAAIEKAQAELRQEYDVREERRRELEFLEKGGNPLDFKFVHAASISVQSTSLTDQLAEQYVTSEAKGSFALAASPHGDSVESSGRPGGSVGREPNTADNLLLFDGENINHNGGRNMKCTGKRDRAAAIEQSSLNDGSHNAKEPEESVIFRLGVRSQAYARRNRSRPNRDSAHAGSTDLPVSGNGSLTFPSSLPDQKDAKSLLLEAQPEDQGISSISNLPISPNINGVSRTLGADDRMEVDAEETHVTVKDMTKDGVPESMELVKSAEELPLNGENDKHSHDIAERVVNDPTHSISDLAAEGKASPPGFSAPLDCTEREKDVCNTERVNGISLPDKDVADLPDKDLSRKTYSVGTPLEVSSVDNTSTGPSTANIGGTFDGNAPHDEGLLVSMANGNSDGYLKEQTVLEEAPSEPDNNGFIGNRELIAVDVHMGGNEESKSPQPMLGNSAIQVKHEVELCDGNTDIKQDVESRGGIEKEKCNGDVNLKPEIELDNLLPHGSSSNDKDLVIISSVVSPTCDLLSNAPLRRVITSTSELQNCAVSSTKLAKKAHEDAILKEARIIEANLKRAGELAVSNISSEQRKKCHWDFVLEEMAWMANDFMQERVWKTTAAGHLCHWIASDGLSKFRHKIMCRRQKDVSRTLAKAVMHFWHSAEVFWTSGEAATGMDKECNSDLSRSGLVTVAEVDKSQGDNHTEAETSGRVFRPVHHYAVRFLKHISTTSDCPVLAEAPATPDRIYDAGILEISWEDQLSEENLFYAVPPGAMKAYRKSVESRRIHFKKTGNAVYQEDREASVCDSVADGLQESVNEEDEGETGTYLSAGVFDGSLSSKLAHKNRKGLQHKSYGANFYEVGPDIAYEPCLESKSGNQPMTFNGKRLPNNLNAGSIPTKRVRTAAARQRVVSPFSAGLTSSLHSTKTDVSSGDTNSFQDDQSSLHGGSQSKRNIEVESRMDFERQLPFDGCEVSTKSKKKKKPKHLGYKISSNLTDSGVLVVPGKVALYEQRMQVDSTAQQDQREHFKKRLESQQYESNGALYAQHPAKKPKLLNKQTETSPETIMPITGSLPSPAASQMSNMSNPNKLIKIIANRDRARKCKTLKMASGQSGTGSPWSPLEDQALVVLVHDMGPNWELISDAINSTLVFKYIFRGPKECKERHKFLIDKSAGDGADSAEDSGSSQPYPSTLPGIPKGGARQLFQRLQGPMEEDTLKAHFDKIILLGQQLLSRRLQIDGEESKERTPVHTSHVVALSQACPNNLAGGVLSPHDLCDATASSQEVLPIGFQGSHANGIALPSHQGPMAPVFATSNSNSMLQVSPGMVLGSSLPSPSASLNAASRDTQSQRHGMPRPASLPVDDQQRMQQYSQMLSSRNIQQSGVSMPGALPVVVDRGVRMLSGGNGMGMMCGMNRGMTIPRPGFQGISSPGMLSMVSSGSMLSGNGVAMQNTVNVHPAAVSGPGNSMLRPRDSLQMPRPGQNTEDHRQVMMQELQMQVSPGNGQPVSPFSGISAPFSNAAASASVQAFPVQQQTHQMAQQPHMLGNPHHPHIQGTNHSSPQQQAYAIRFKEQQHPQRIMPQNQHLFSGSSAISPVQNGSQIQQQSQSSSPATPLPSSQAQHMQQQLSRNPQLGSGMPNQIVKQRQRQPLPQQQQQQQQQQQPSPLRHQQQQRQQPQQQGKVMKGLGRGNMLMHQNIPADASHVNGLGPTHRNQVSEKHLMQQGQGFYSGNPGLNPSLPQNSGQQKMYPRPVPQSSKKMPPIPSHTESTSQGSIQASSTHTLIASQQSPVVSSVTLASQQPQRQTIQPTQAMPRIMLQQNRQLNSDGRRQTLADPVQVNQMIPTASSPPCSDSVASASAISPAAQWKPDQSYETNTPPSTAHLASSPQENLVGTETLMPPPSQGLVQRQFSEGAVSMHEHETGGLWQQQQRPHQQQQTQQPQHQHQHRQTVHGDVYARPSNSGPG